jgi:hypothetical protein
MHRFYERKASRAQAQTRLYQNELKKEKGGFLVASEVEFVVQVIHMREQRSMAYNEGPGRPEKEESESVEVQPVKVPYEAEQVACPVCGKPGSLYRGKGRELDVIHYKKHGSQSPLKHYVGVKQWPDFHVRYGRRKN